MGDFCDFEDPKANFLLFHLPNDNESIGYLNKFFEISPSRTLSISSVTSLSFTPDPKLPQRDVHALDKNDE